MYARVPPGLYTDRMIYSPQVPVFRDDEGALLPQPFLCDVVSAAACNLRATKGREREHVDQTMRVRASKLVSLARVQGASCLVLGAWGTGVFRLPDGGNLADAAIGVGLAVLSLVAACACRRPRKRKLA